MNKTVSSVMDISEPWDNPHGGQIWWVTAFTTDGEVLSAGRKDEDAARELQGLLIEATGIEQDFVLEPAKPTSSGKTKWKILGFGTPGGAATYTAPGVQGGGTTPPPVAQRSRSPEHDHYIQERMDRRTALMQAVAINAGAQLYDVADRMYMWLRMTSEPASSAYHTAGSPPEAGVGSEETSPSGGSDRGGTPPTTQTPLAGPGLTPDGGTREEGVVSEGKEPAPSSPRPGEEVGRGDSHTHDWQPRQGVKGFLVCECGKTRKKEEAPAT